MFVTRRFSAPSCVLVVAAAALVSLAARAPASAPVPLARDYPVRPVPFTDVHVADGFWAPKIEVNRTVSIPFAFKKCEETGRVANLERAGAVLAGHPPADRSAPKYPFDDTDLYKVIEGASYALCVRPDKEMEAYIARLVETIGRAQEPDGYLYPARTIDPVHPHPWAGPTRWSLEKVDSHELYDAGHLYEAAVAHYQATGSRDLLDIALKSAELLDRTFGPGKLAIWPGHQITEMGLVKLYRATGEARYLNLARFLLDVRGPDGTEGAGREYNQSHEPVVEQSEAVGHAVRATYMYSGMADVAALTGDASYTAAIDRIWANVVGRKLYITGGIGATGNGEAFGKDYDLPNMSAYNETCAAIGNTYWNHRLFLLHGEGKYIDVMERTLYNGLISGVSLDGMAFFYPNPLESNGQHARQPWFGVACCPGNVTRFLASFPGYMYAQQGDTLYVNLFAAGTATVPMDGGRSVTVRQETRYPWDGAVRMTITPAKPGAFAIAVRIPGWAREEPVPSDLYRFVDRSDAPVRLAINGQDVPVTTDRGYARLARDWQAGDVVTLDLPMPVRRVAAHDAVAADRGRVALQRGPIVYAVEGKDNPDGRVRNLVLDRDAALAAEMRPSLLGGLTVVTGRATALVTGDDGRVVRRAQPLTAIPYYAWANRGPGEMTVWLPTSEVSARVLPRPTLASTSRVSVSSGRGQPSLNDLELPASSEDESVPPFHFWPHKGTTEWVEYALPRPTRVSEASVYWFDDTGHGGCRVPASWRVLYRDGTEWKAVTAESPYGTAKDALNRVRFAPVTTDALRLEIVLQPERSAGLHEWTVR